MSRFEVIAFSNHPELIGARFVGKNWRYLPATEFNAPLLHLWPSKEGSGRSLVQFLITHPDFKVQEIGTSWCVRDADSGSFTASDGILAKLGLEFSIHGCRFKRSPWEFSSRSTGDWFDAPVQDSQDSVLVTKF